MKLVLDAETLAAIEAAAAEAAAEAIAVAIRTDDFTRARQLLDFHDLAGQLRSSGPLTEGER